MAAGFKRWSKGKSNGTRFSKPNYQSKKKPYKDIKNKTEDFTNEFIDEEFQSPATTEELAPTLALFEKYALIDAMDLQMGFISHASDVPKKGWLINIQTVIFSLLMSDFGKGS